MKIPLEALLDRTPIRSWYDIALEAKDKKVGKPGTPGEGSDEQTPDGLGEPVREDDLALLGPGQETGEHFPTF